MSFIVTDLRQLYRNVFGGRPYVIEGQNEQSFNDTVKSALTASVLKQDFLGREVWLPVKFINLGSAFENGELLLPYCTVQISAKKTIVKTPMLERKGTVKEIYNVDDYTIGLKGFCIDEAQRLWPEEQIIHLRELFESTQAVSIDNALTNLFLKDTDQRVVIESLEFPEVEGGRGHIRPFSMSLESDSVFTLELA